MQLLLEQQSIFFMRMEDSLAVTIRSKIVESRATINDCYKALEKRFLEIRPLHLRRRDWFTASKFPLESYNERVVRLQALVVEAEIEKMSVDDWTMFQSMLGARGEPALHDEVMKVTNPTLNRVMEAATTHEAIAKARSEPTKILHILKATASALAVGNKFCRNCGRDDHTKPEECFAKDRMCHDCHKVGHLARMCRAPSSRSTSAERGCSPTRRPLSPRNRQASRSPSIVRARFVYLGTLKHQKWNYFASLVEERSTLS